MNILPRKNRAMGKSLNKDQSKSRQIPDMDGKKDQNEKPNGKEIENMQGQVMIPSQPRKR